MPFAISSTVVDIRTGPSWSGRPGPEPLPESTRRPGMSAVGPGYGLVSRSRQHPPGDEFVPHGRADRGGRPFAPAELRPPAPYRLYRAAVTEHSVLCPRNTGEPCADHGLAYDHRTAVELS